MKQWYASVNYGLELIAGDIIKEYGAEDITILDSALLFLYPDEINLKCINNLFIIISSFSSKNVEEAAKKLLKLPFKIPALKGRSFRIIIMDCGKLRAIPNNVMNEFEKRLSYQTGLFANRANPDTEIWLNRRNNGLTYFMARTEKHSSFDKKLHKGELRPDITDIMIHKAKINNQCIVADIFGGWGAIAAAVTESGKYRKIYTGDIDDKCVEYQKTRFCKKRNCVVQKWDVCMLPLENMSVDSVITDPPWGEYAKIDTAQFYDRFISEVSRILRINGSFVFLSSAQCEAKKSLEKYNFIYSDISLKINGKDTFLFCAEHSK